MSIVEISATPREEMDIQTARTILQSIVETTSGAAINEKNPLGDFEFTYSNREICLAVKMIAESIRGISQSVPDGVPCSRKSKEIEQAGTLYAHFFTDNVCLGLDKADSQSPDVEFWFPINEEKFTPESTLTVSFKERGNNGDMKTVSSSDLRNSMKLFDNNQSQENRTTLISQLHSLWLGLRWMSANLLAWEKNQIIMPEDLGESSVPHIITGTKKVSAIKLFCGQSTAAKLHHK